MESVGSGLSGALRPIVESMVVIGAYFLLSITFLLLWADVAVIRMPSGAQIPALEYRNIFVEYVCLLLVIILTDISVGDLIEEKQERFTAEGWAKTALFLILTTIAPLAKETPVATSKGVEPNLLSCHLIQYGYQYSGADGYRSTVGVFVIFFVLFALCSSVSIGRHIRKKNAEGGQPSTRSYSLVFATVSVFVAVLALSAYFAVEFSKEISADCNAILGGSNLSIFTLMMSMILLYVAATVALTKYYSVRVLRPAISGKYNGSSAVFSTVFLLILPLIFMFFVAVLYQFASNIHWNGSVPGIGQFLSSLVEAVANTLSLFVKIVFEVMPQAFFGLLEIFTDLLRRIYELYQSNNLPLKIIAAMALVFVAFIMLRIAWTLLVRLWRYPHVLLGLLVILLAIAVGFIFGLSLLEKNPAELVEMPVK